MTASPVTPGGWYADPTARHEYRYWDGTDWTPQVSDGGVTTGDAIEGRPPTTSVGSSTVGPPASPESTPAATLPTATAEDQTCPSCGSSAVTAEWRYLDPETGKPTRQPLAQLAIWGLLALGGIAWLVAVVAFIAQEGVRLGILDVFATIVAIGAIINFVRVTRAFFGVGRVRTLFCWCRACQTEWTVPNQPGAQSTLTSAAPTREATPPAAAAAASEAHASSAPVESAPKQGAGPPEARTAGDSDLRWMMQALEAMPLPDSLRGWDQVISVEIEDQPGVFFAWIIDGDRWQVVDGQTMRATLRLVAKEKRLIKDLATGSAQSHYRLMGVGHPVGGISTYKCTKLVHNMAAYLRSSHGPEIEDLQSRIGRRHR
jgi:hypothetical protein